MKTERYAFAMSCRGVFCHGFTIVVAVGSDFNWRQNAGPLCAWAM